MAAVGGRAHTGGMDTEALFGRSLLTTHDWSVADLDTLLAVAAALELLDRAGVRTELLPDELAYAMFFDNSTRTKSAWAGAAARLGMQPVIVDGSSTQVAHGETAEETGAMLGMNAHALGVRHDLILGEGNSFMRDVLRGISDYLAATADPRVVPVVNLQCDVDHPTQSLADLLWLREHFGGDVAGRRITVSWAYSPSYAKPLSVPQGVVSLLTRFGAHVTLAHPEGYALHQPVVDHAAALAAESGGSLAFTDDMEAACAGAHVIYAKAWASPLDYGDPAAAVARNQANGGWTLGGRHLAASDDAKVMHCLPVRRNVVIADEVLDGPASIVQPQAANRMWGQMALLLKMLA